MEWTKKNWKTVLILTVANIMLSGLVAFAVNAFSAREIALQGAASVEYVDKQDSAIGSILKGQDAKISTMDAKIDLKADKADIAAMRTTVENIYNLILQMATQKQIDKADAK